jgi:hypothetical protein
VLPLQEADMVTIAGLESRGDKMMIDLNLQLAKLSSRLWTARISINWATD